MLKIIANEHPCTDCIVKVTCGFNLCEEYSQYYHMWKNRVQDLLIQLMVENGYDHTRIDPDHVYWNMMQHFINAPGMPPRVILSPEKKINPDKEKEYFNRLLKKYFSIYINT